MNARVALAVGRLSSEKGHRDLVSAVAKIKASRPALNLCVVIVGDGPERSAVEQFANKLGVRSVIVMAGQQNDVRPFYGIADVFALPSHSEGSPNVLLEAMAARLPIVTTAVGGSVELVTNNLNALLVQPRDTEALARALERVLCDAELAARLARSAEITSRQYTPEAYARSMVALYEKTLKNSETGD
jgi:glycosyltransferase involved in cell wall biosynthesis